MTERETFHPPVHSPNGQLYSGLPHTWERFKSLGHPLLLFQEHQQGAESEAKQLGASIVPYQVKCCQWCQHPIPAPVCVPSAPLLIQHPANSPRKATESGPSTWAPFHPCGRTKRSLLTPGFSPALVIVI